MAPFLFQTNPLGLILAGKATHPGFGALSYPRLPLPSPPLLPGSPAGPCHGLASGFHLDVGCCRLGTRTPSHTFPAGLDSTWLRRMRCAGRSEHQGARWPDATVTASLATLSAVFPLRRVF